MFPYSPLHKKYLTFLGLGSLIALGSWLAWQVLVLAVHITYWFIAFVPGHLWPLRWDLGPGMLFFQYLGWASFLIPAGTFLAALWVGRRTPLRTLGGLWLILAVLGATGALVYGLFWLLILLDRFPSA